MWFRIEALGLSVKGFRARVNETSGRGDVQLFREVDLPNPKPQTLNHEP